MACPSRCHTHGILKVISPSVSSLQTLRLSQTRVHHDNCWCLSSGKRKHLLFAYFLLLFFLDINKMPIKAVQFSSVQWLSCVRLCDPMNRSTPGLPVHHQLLEFTQTLSIESVMPSSHLIVCRPFSSCPQSLPASESFPMSQHFS